MPMDKKQKQELDEVLKKYTRSKWDTAKSYLRNARTGAILGVGLDLVFTAGFGTVVAVTAAALPAIKGISRTALRMGIMQHGGERGQKVSASADAHMIIADIEFKLANAFSKAAATKLNPSTTELAVSQRVKNEYLGIADEAEEDIRKLSPAFKIVSGGNGGFGTEKFQLLIRRDLRQPSDKTVYYTLDETRAIIREKITEELKPKPKAAKPPLPKPKKRSGFNV